jgi:hypothetical protein
MKTILLKTDIVYGAIIELTRKDIRLCHDFLFQLLHVCIQLRAQHLLISKLDYSIKLYNYEGEHQCPRINENLCSMILSELFTPSENSVVVQFSSQQFSLITECTNEHNSIVLRFNWPDSSETSTAGIRRDETILKYISGKGFDATSLPYEVSEPVSRSLTAESNCCRGLSPTTLTTVVDGAEVK